MHDRPAFHSFDACGGGEVASAREQYLQAMASFTEMTRTRAERLASLLVKQGELQSGQVGRFAEDLVRRTQRNRETMSRLVQREVKRQLSGLGIATRDEVARLQQRVRALEQAVERPTGTPGRAAGRSTSSRSGTSRAAAPKGSTSSRSASSGTTTRRGAAAGGGRPGGATSGRSGGAASERPAGGRSRGTTRRSSPETGQETSEGE
jgi:polyhydroxyalkanoate synthesis regulator phasin